MNRTDVVRALEGEGVREADDAVEKLLEIVTVSLAAGEPISIRNFGKLQMKERAAIVRKNPKTGEPIHVPGRKTVTFSPAPALKNRVNRSR